VRRYGFLAGSAALACAPRAARATGGLDVDDGAAAPHVVRVLLATGAVETPQQLEPWRFGWRGRTYRGIFGTVALPDGRSALVNSLPLDAYLYGVLSREVSPGWAPSAQQAQAIVSRTYALLKLRPERPYDIVAGDADQNYGGIESESVEGRAAVDATSGTIVSYGGRPARVAYSACCGGRTASAAQVWDTPYPYLPSIADPYCADAPHFAWQTSIAVAPLARPRAPLAGVGALESVAIVGTPGLRPDGLACVGRTGTIDVSLPLLRAEAGPTVVRSTYVRVAQVAGGGASLALEGTGFGHGVGLCQWGARGLGAQGTAATAIVAFYFPGTALARA